MRDKNNNLETFKEYSDTALIAWLNANSPPEKYRRRKDKPMVALEPNAWLFDGEYGGQYLVSGEQHKCARVLKVKDKETVKNTKRIGGLIGMVYRMFRAFAKAGLWIVIAVAAGLLGSAITNKVFKR